MLPAGEAARVPGQAEADVGEAVVAQSRGDIGPRGAEFGHPDHAVIRRIHGAVERHHHGVDAAAAAGGLIGSPAAYGLAREERAPLVRIVDADSHVASLRAGAAGQQDRPRQRSHEEDLADRREASIVEHPGLLHGSVPTRRSTPLPCVPSHGWAARGRTPALFNCRLSGPAAASVVMALLGMAVKLWTGARWCRTPYVVDLRYP